MTASDKISIINKLILKIKNMKRGQSKISQKVKIRNKKQMGQIEKKRAR